MRRATIPLTLAAGCVLAFLLMGQAPSPHGAMDLYSAGGGLSAAAADAAYLRLDATNDPLTGGLSVNAGTSASDASITTPTGEDLWISAAGGTGSRALKILSSSSSSVGDGVELHGSAAAASGRTSILLSTDVSTAADRYPVRITRSGSVDVWKVNGLGQSLAADGTANNPSISFASDVDSGLYWGSANLIYMAAGGLRSQAWQNGTQTFYASDGATPQLTVSATAITSTRPYVAPTGTVGAPAFATTGDLDSGFYGDGSGSLFVTTDNSWAWSWGPTVVESGRTLALLAGAAATPSLTASTDAATGLYWPAASTLAVSTGGTARSTWSTTALTNTVPFVGPDGSLGSSSFRGSDADSGIYFSGSAIILSNDADIAFQVGATEIQSQRTIRPTSGSYDLGTTTYRWQNLHVGAGSASDPSVTVNDADSGMYRSGANTLDLVVDGDNAARFSGQFETQILLDNAGSSSAPTMAGISDPNTGVALYGSDSMSLVAGGVDQVTISTTGIALPQYTSGTMTAIRVSAGLATTLPTKPGCAGSSDAGKAAVFDDTNDALPAAFCVCMANSGGTYAWRLPDASGTACPL